MKVDIIVREKEIEAFREACEFHQVEIISEQMPETFNKAKYPGLQFEVEASPADMYYVGKATQAILLEGRL